MHVGRLAVRPCHCRAKEPARAARLRARRGGSVAGRKHGGLSTAGRGGRGAWRGDQPIEALAREEVVVAVAEMIADDDASTVWSAVHRRAATANWESAPATSGSAPGRGGPGLYLVCRPDPWSPAPLDRNCVATIRPMPGCRWSRVMSSGHPPSLAPPVPRD